MTQAENAVLRECVSAFAHHKFTFVDFKRLNKDGCQWLYEGMFTEEGSNGMIWRNNTGSTDYGGRRFVKYGLPGSPDLLGLATNGRFIGWEVKAGAHVLSSVQRSFHLIAKKFGCLIGVGNSYEQTNKKLTEWGF